ncbi:MAG TPA: NAD(P)/FAD-dependent oxidoreductase [Gammaproteobacteria bacterium]|nr:NAD(P)/FAD-dependent oxidoreductase [Gammaproteobacteria bacterium]HIL96199.1 NAD(P)/FAD-dependent oxidoreductase [Pseudomonadales bacterium]
MSETKNTNENAANLASFDPTGGANQHPQEYYDKIKQKFAEERDLRLNYRPEGTRQFNTNFDAGLSRFGEDSYNKEVKPRAPLNDTVEVLFIGGGFSALLTTSQLREIGVESIRIVERGADVGGTWYWNRYPGAACDVVSYDYLPLLDEMDYVPRDHYAKAPEIFEHCQNIAKYYDLYDLAVFQTTVTSTEWNDEEQLWHIKTDRGDHMKSKFVICANGPMSKPKLARIDGIENFKGHSFHTGRWDYDYCGDNLENLQDKRVAIIGTGATAIQAVPKLAEQAKELYVFQRTPSSIDIRKDWPTDPNWARKLKPGWQAKRRQKTIDGPQLTAKQLEKRASMPVDEKIRRQENANIDHMMWIHQRIDDIVHDKDIADALKPWYMFMCKRPCFHEDYLPAFNKPNVHLVDTHGKGVKEISDRGPVFDDKVYDVDVIIYATGFEVQKTGIYNEIVGKNNTEINDYYSNGIRTLFGIHSNGYPNLFIMAGYQASFQFNITDVLTVQGAHIAACIDHARKSDYQSIDITPEIEEWWVQEVIEHRGKTDRNKDCTPGYYNFEGEDNRRQDGTYNGGFNRYVELLRGAKSKMDDIFIVRK